MLTDKVISDFATAKAQKISFSFISAPKTAVDITFNITANRIFKTQPDSNSI